MNLPAAISLAAAVIGLGVGGLALGLGSSPRWAHYRLLALIAVCAAAYCVIDVFTTLDLRPGTCVFVGGVGSTMGAVAIVCWSFYADRQLEQPAARTRKVARVLLALAGVGWIVPGVLLDGTTTRLVIPAVGATYQFPTPNPFGIAVFSIEVCFLADVFARFVCAARRGIDGASAHTAAVGIVLAGALYDTLITVGLFRGPFLLPLSFIGAVGAIGVQLVHAFMADAGQLDAMTHRLEHLVDERTKELVAAEAALVRAEKLAALGQLSAGVAHEINNPAAAVAGNLEYLRDELESGHVGDETFACIDDSLEAVDRIARIVRQLLDIGRAAATAPASDATDVSRAVQQALGSVTLPPTAVVTTDIEPELFVRGDQASLVQVLVNVILNASQALADTPAGRIDVRAAESSGSVVITVTDNGVGMSDETQRRLFEPFYTTKPFGQGTGLGLSLSLGIVRSLGGDLVVESREGETTMRIRLPIAMAPSPLSSGRIRARARRHAVLLVEDDSRVRKALERTLSARFDVVVAEGVDEALRRIDEASFDVILSDWKMPNGGGRQLYELTAERRPELGDRMVFMTGAALSAPDRSFIEEHGLTVLPKPLALDAISAAVSAVDEKTARRRARAV